MNTAHKHSEKGTFKTTLKPV